jgi:hypothetical protein
MIEIHWLWIPLIVTLILQIIAVWIQGATNPLETRTSLAATVCLAISMVIYIIAGIWWLFTHIKILT